MPRPSRSEGPDAGRLPFRGPVPGPAGGASAAGGPGLRAGAGEAAPPGQMPRSCFFFASNSSSLMMPCDLSCASFSSSAT